MSTQPSGIDNRNYSRVNTFTRARYRKLSHPDEQQICPSALNIEASDGKRLFRESGLPESVASFLINLDTKLNHVIAHLNREEIVPYFPDELVVLDLSASGLLVQSGELAAGDFIELVVYLGELPPTMVSGVAEVIRSAKTAPDGGETYALKFTRLREVDREEIVRFVFKENRNRIRTEKYK